MPIPTLSVPSPLHAATVALSPIDSEHGDRPIETPTETTGSAPAAAPSRPRWSARSRWGLAGLVTGAIVIRLPAFLADRHLTFDDGVFGASAVAMRAGSEPFREVFSSQGPLFLPLVWLADLVGFRGADAPRLLTLGAGVALTVTVYLIGRRISGWAGGILAASVVTVSGSVLWTTGPLAADGPALALGTAAVAAVLAYRDRPTPALALLTGLLIGAAFSVKSLFAVPPGLAIAWVFLEARRPRQLALALAGSAAVVVAAVIPWGVSAVWDQAVEYHLEAADDRTPGANASKVVSTLWDRDLLVVVLAVAAAILVFWHWIRRRPRPGASGHSPPDGEASSEAPGHWSRHYGPLGVWLGGVLVVYLAEHPLWRPHLAHVVPPLALLAVLAARRHLMALGLVAIVAAGFHFATNTDILAPGGYGTAEARAVALLDDLPPGALAISDEPGLVWRAGVRTPADLVDASILRIRSERITAQSLERAAQQPSVCAVLVWSHRFADLDLAPHLPDYRVRERFGDDRVLYQRRNCRPT